MQIEFELYRSATSTTHRFTIDIENYPNLTDAYVAELINDFKDIPIVDWIMNGTSTVVEGSVVVTSARVVE